MEAAAPHFNADSHVTADALARDANSLRSFTAADLVQAEPPTRMRWSLNSVTFSSEERVKQRLPGFEVMFTAEGHIVEEKLQAFAFAKGLPFNVTVVTGPCGSYREEHLLNFLEKHLEPWGRAGSGS